MTVMNLLLIRHGLTDWVGQRHAGRTPGVHLNDEGRVQAAALAQWLSPAAVRLAAIYASPLERTLETAQPLAEAHNLAVQIGADLVEVDPGDWTGRAFEELRKEDLWTVIQTYPSGARFPGGESVHGVQARMVALLDAIRDAHPGQTVAVVSHADPIRLAVAHYVGLPLDLYHRLSIDPASVTLLAFSRGGVRLVCLNAGESPAWPAALRNELEAKNKERDHARPGL